MPENTTPIASAAPARPAQPVRLRPAGARPPSGLACANIGVVFPRLRGSAWISSGCRKVLRSQLDVRLESVTEGVLVTGTVTGTAHRRVRAVPRPGHRRAWRSTSVELFAYPDSATDETTEQDEVHRLEGDLLDLEPVVRDAVVLGLPLDAAVPAGLRRALPRPAGSGWTTCRPVTRTTCSTRAGRRSRAFTDVDVARSRPRRTSSPTNQE